MNKQQKNQCWLQSHFLKSGRPKEKEDTIEMVRHQNLSATYMISVMFPEAWTASSRRFMTLSLHTQGSSMLQSRIKAALLYSHTGIHLCLCQLRVPHSKDVERLLGLAESCLHGKQGQPGDRQELPSFPAEEGEFTTQAKCRMLGGRNVSSRIIPLLCKAGSGLWSQHSLWPELHVRLSGNQGDKAKYQ